MASKTLAWSKNIFKKIIFFLQVAEFAEKAPDRVSVPELLAQLKTTETELENLKVLLLASFTSEQLKTETVTFKIRKINAW